MSGQTTADELGKLDSIVPDGVKMVIFQPGGNDNKYQSKTPVGDTGANIRAIVQKLLDRHILVLFLGGRDKAQYIRDLDVTFIGPIIFLLPTTAWQADKEHWTPNGCKMVAEMMFPLVRDLLDKVPKQQ